jgi:signal transduction histidine kinase
MNLDKKTPLGFAHDVRRLRCTQDICIRLEAITPPHQRLFLMYSEELLLTAKKLHFPPNVEAAFITHSNVATLAALRRYWWALVVVCALMLGLDMVFFQHYRWEFAAIRVAIAFPGLWIMLRSRRLQPALERRIHIAWHILATAIIFNLFQWFITPEDSAFANYGLTNIVFVVLCFTLSRASFRLSFFCAICVVIAYNAIAIPAQFIPHPNEFRIVLIGTNIRIVFVFLIAAVLGYILESMRRQDFVKTELLKQERNRVAHQNTEILRQQEILESSARDVELANTSLQNLNNELQRVNEELRTANTFKTKMLSMASHDLKNPLAGISGLAEALLDTENLDEQQMQFAEQIQRSSAQMIRLIQNLLDSAAIELGALTLRKSLVNASSVWASVYENLEPLALAKGQTITQAIEPHCVLSADPNSLHQVFENLLSNAIKYSPQGASIHVSLAHCDTSFQHKKQRIQRFSVKDQGPGVSDEDKEKMFGMFQKLSAEPTAGESSHGVGLAIVKQIVDAHGGSISVESTLGTGSTFIVELPLQSEPPMTVVSEHSDFLENARYSI